MTILAVIALTMNGSTLAVPKGSADLTAFLDSVAVEAGYLAVRDDGGGNDPGGLDGYSPREKSGSDGSA